MNILHHATALLLVCALLTGLAGCGAVIAGGAAATGTYAYMTGKAQGTYDASLDKSHAASLVVCKEMGIPVLMERKGDTTSEIKGKLSDDSVTIDLKLVGKNLTEITVRVGLMGNENASRRILGAISQRL